MDTPSANLRARVEALLKKRSVAWRRVIGGYTKADRWTATFEDAPSCFVKAGTDDSTSTRLRHEYEHIYSRLAAPFLPRLIGWDDDGSSPFLVIEDLSGSAWPPPWSPERVEAVRATLDGLHSMRLEGLPRAEAWGVPEDVSTGWDPVRKDPGPFLGLGLCSERWLASFLDFISRSGLRARLSGEELCHCDVRSDNICFDGNRVVLIDWDIASIGNGDVDIAFWLPSLASEGGPPPESILPNAPAFAALVASLYAARAPFVRIEEAHNGRNIQLEQLQSALPWMVRALDLPPLDGPAMQDP
jgi:hypothetical protein